MIRTLFYIIFLFSLIISSIFPSPTYKSLLSSQYLCNPIITVLAKWSPLLWQSYNSSDYIQNWKSFINDHFFNGYVDSAYQLLPLKFDLKDDNSIILSLNQLTEIIIKRGIDISNKVNKSISFDAIEHYSIIFE